MIDLSLTALLLLVLPGYMLWRSWTARGKPPEAKIKRYMRSMVIAALLDGLLIVQWVRMERRPAVLGFDAPVSLAGLIGLGIAACVLALMVATTFARPRLGSNPAEAPSANIFPETRVEIVMFVVFSLVVGCSWEALYRGFLLWWLPLHLGFMASIAVAAGAYGVAHGFKSTKLFVGSLVSALIFTAAFAITRSLWWLMLVHCGLPLVGASAFHRRRRMFDPATLPMAARAQPSSP